MPAVKFLLKNCVKYLHAITAHVTCVEFEFKSTYMTPHLIDSKLYQNVTELKIRTIFTTELPHDIPVTEYCHYEIIQNLNSGRDLNEIYFPNLNAKQRSLYYKYELAIKKGKVVFKRHVFLLPQFTCKSSSVLLLYN